MLRWQDRPPAPVLPVPAVTLLAPGPILAVGFLDQRVCVLCLGGLSAKTLLQLILKHNKTETPCYSFTSLVKQFTELIDGSESQTPRG